MIRFEIQDPAGEAVEMFLRAMQGSDLNYIRNSWIRNYQPFAKVSSGIFTRNHPRIIDELLSSRSASTVVACTGDDPMVVHGWACGETDGPLHWVFVPYPLRGRGIARELIKAVLGGYPTNINVTHRFKSYDSASRFSYNPYLLRVNA